MYASKPTRYDAPGHCIVIPGRTSDENGGVALDGVYDGVRGDIRLWVSYAGLHKIAQQFPQMNLVERSSLELADEHADASEDLLRQANARITELEGQLDRISGLSRDGFQVTKAKGPAPKVKVSA